MIFLISLGILIYSVSVLGVVSFMGDIGVRCILGRKVQEEISRRDYRWSPEAPSRGDWLTKVGSRPIVQYTDYVDALRDLRRRVGQDVEVEWQGTDGRHHRATARVRHPPLGTYVWSILWFLQEMLIFLIGARVYWKRPHDASARLFFWLCVVTVGAYIGGYHWSEIVISRPLIFLFAGFAVFVPVVSLHFYLVFPRPNPVFERSKRRCLVLLYTIPTAFTTALWAGMEWSHAVKRSHPEQVEGALRLVKNLALVYVGLSVAIFALCIVCLLFSFVRGARNHSERNQVKWILWASLVSTVPIAFLLWEASQDPASLGREMAAWPMFVVSLLYTLAYAMSITRYKLMQVDEIINRSVIYFAVSVTAGLLYSGVLVLSALVIGARWQRNQTSQAMVVAILAVVFLIGSGAARERFQKAIDRRFYREKYKFDQAMRKMSQAVGSLVDRATLGRRLLEAAAEVLRLEWGAIYFAEGASGPFVLAACVGPEPDERAIPADNPLLERLRREPTLRMTHTASYATESDPALDAMIALGGELASPLLEAEGEMAGFLVLGPKRSGLPYEDEEIVFLGALGSVATLALHSSGIRHRLESLDLELRAKAEKIAEQHRRIMILQEQLLDRRDGQAPPPEEPPPAPTAFDAIKGSSPAVRRMVALAGKVAASPSSVLIRGESGTGKELLAQAIHQASPRRDGPFVKVHCAALSQSLLESELFGHVKGAFTGADRDRVGRFQQADKGTLFLDEIGDINLEVQTKLLRVLQEMSFEKVGSSQPVFVDVRVLAATHQDLEALIAAGRFRSDLYYRLNVISLQAPPLRERREDIFELALHFLRLHAGRVGKPVTHLSNEAIEALVAYDWPGNIRELENVIECSVVLADGPELTLDDLPIAVRRPSRTRRPRMAVATAAPVRAIGARATDWEEVAAPPDGDGGDLEAEAFERLRLVEALRDAGGNKSEAARLLAMPRSTFFSKLKKHGLA